MHIQTLAPLLALLAATSAAPLNAPSTNPIEPRISIPNLPSQINHDPADPVLVPRATTAPKPITKKRGAITNPFPGVTAPFSQYKKISWDMNWWHGAPPAQPSNWLFVPMLTHLVPDQYWANADFRHNASKFPYIAGFLEPDGQVNISDAVVSWKKNLEPLAVNHTLIPPVVGQNGLGWLKNFTSACTGCTLGKGPVAFTIYAWANNAGVADFKHHVAEFKAAYPGRELWAMNIGVLGTANNTATEWLMRKLVGFLEGEPAVTRYAWNGAGSFYNKTSGKLTPLAKLYATL